MIYQKKIFQPIITLVLFITLAILANLQQVVEQKSIKSVIQQPKLPYHILQVYGNTTFGYYYVDLFFGSPPQQQSVIIDTGSSMLTVPCTKCTSCSKTHIDNYFDLAKSKSAKFLTCASQSILCLYKCGGDVDGTQSCTFTVSYAEGSSLEGIYLQDYVQFQSNTIGQQVKIDFGCTTKQTNLFLKQEANGIFGLAPQRTPIFEKVFNKHSPKTHQLFQVSLCLRKNGGYMSVGGAQQRFHRKPSIKTTFTEDTNLYSIQKVGDVKLGDKVFHKAGEPVGSFGIFIDSGSTFTYFPSNQYEIFIKQLDQKCSKSDSCQITKSSTPRCYKMLPNHQGQISIKQLQKSIKQTFPTIIMQIAGADLQWIPTEYLILRDLNSKDICSGIQKFDRFLLGSNWMINKDIVLNIKDKTVQIFPQSHCQFNKQSNQQNLQGLSLKQSSNEKNNQEDKIQMSQLFDKVSGNPSLDSIKQNTKWQKQIIISIIGIFFIVILILLFLFCFKDKNKDSHRINHEDNQQDHDSQVVQILNKKSNRLSKKSQKFEIIQQINQSTSFNINLNENTDNNVDDFEGDSKLINDHEQEQDNIQVADQDL